MDDPLVDSEGFPRSDIDVYAVRTARHRILCTSSMQHVTIHVVQHAACDYTRCPACSM